MASVLVTGGNGFLGAWLVRELIKQGHEVNCLVRRASDLSELAGLKVNFKYGDVTDLNSIMAAAKGAELLYHLAGLIAYRKADREKMNQINVGGTANVIQAVKELQINRLVHLSSVVAVGAGFDHHTVLNEDSPFNLTHLDLGYFETKRQAEQLVKVAVKEKKIDAVILNPSTIYGAGDAKKGSRKTQIKVAQGKFKFFPSGGVNVVAVEDVVAGIVSAAQRGRNGERYILCSENLLLRNVFEMIAEAAKVAPPKIPLPDWLIHSLGATGDFLQGFGYNTSLSRENAWAATLYHWFDNSKARRELDFKPRSAKIAIENSVNWMSQAGLIGK